MNKTFENLMYESGLTASGCFEKMDSYDQGAIMMFADLIVKECMDQVYYTREEMIDETISQNIRARIAKHFGVVSE